MREQLESNLLTKYAAGLMTSEELRNLEDWLRKNPQYRMTLAVIKQRVDAMVGNLAQNRW
ncbi:MAG: hypothetical protein KG003_01910 [Bacteroidetes bacterium]|nr:hypothetical protein [Bacteroidota bacterium]